MQHDEVRIQGKGGIFLPVEQNLKKIKPVMSHYKPSIIANHAEKDQREPEDGRERDDDKEVMNKLCLIDLSSLTHSSSNQVFSACTHTRNHKQEDW